MKRISVDYTGLFDSGALDEKEFDRGAARNGKILEKYREKRDRGEIAFTAILDDEKYAERAELMAEEKKDFREIIVIGIGGSNLGTLAVCSALEGGKKATFFDNVDPVTFEKRLDGINPETALINVVSKSGNTTETIANFITLRDIMEKKLSRKITDRVVVTTDPGPCELAELAGKEGYATLMLPEEVGGRFSVLTAVGLFPLAFCGYDVKALIEGARMMSGICFDRPPAENPAFITACALHRLYREGYGIQVLMPYCDRLGDTANWYRQLWAESLGKLKSREGETVRAGQTPVVARGATDQHSQFQLYAEGPRDKVVTFMENEGPEGGRTVPEPPATMKSFDYLTGKSFGELLRAEKRAAEYALCRAGCPNMTVTFPELSEHTLGQYFFLMEYQTVLTAEFLDVNPYDQPGVEEGKKAAAAILGKEGLEDRRRELEDFFEGRRRKV